MKRDSCENSTSGLALPLSEAELIAKMDAMTPKLKKCAGYEGHECDSTFNLDDWNALTDIKKSQIRNGLDWYVKPKILANGKTGFTVDSRCNKCRYQHEKKARFRGSSNRQGRPRSSIKHDGPKKRIQNDDGEIIVNPEYTFFCRVVPTCSIL